MACKRIAFHETQAHERLLNLSRTPYDVSSRKSLLADNRKKYKCLGRYFTLHYWAQRVDDAVLDALQALADECDLIGQFCDMKEGAIMNSVAGLESEHRQVMHTATRDLFCEHPRAEEITRLSRIELEKLKLFLEEIADERVCSSEGKAFDTLIHVGIGGSDLGPRSVYEALKPYRQGRKKLIFISNVDPDDMAANLEDLDLSTCLVSVVSKSGTTLETRTNELLLRRAFEEQGLDPSGHIVAVTGKGSPLDDPGNYLRSFYMFDSIGGRYSTTSMVGMFSLGFCLGYSQIVDFLEGASTTDRESEEPDIRKNPALLLALLGLWNRTYLKMPTVAILPYSQGLHRFTAHLQQCDMESNGKSLDRNGKLLEFPAGPIVWGEPGTNGQHAFYQLLHQGKEPVPLEFIGFRRSRLQRDLEVEGTTSQQKLLANMLAQSVAFAVGKKDENANRFFAGNRPSSILLGDRLTPGSMGALLALYEAKVVFQGFAWNINSFDQEGVQLGKVLAKMFLEEMEGGEVGEASLEGKILQLTGLNQIS